MSKTTIGFIGLGLLGTGFVTRLVACGYPVVGHDVVAEKLEAAGRLGVAPAGSPAEVAARAGVTLVCVTTTADVAAVIEGPRGILEAGEARGRVVVDHSTTEIATTKRLAALLAERAGIDLVDAPVSGGPAAAETGTLAIMAGGRPEAIARIAPVMESLGRFTHMGEVGAGQATKLVNQTLVLTNYCVIAEALRLAESYGVDPSKVPHALATGHAGSNLLPVLFERMSARDWTPRGFTRQVLKDLEMLNDAARSRRLAMPMAAQALTLFRMAVAAGYAEQDGASVLEMIPPGDKG
jgi:3-hydroxyisobutyrate dehydrogenase-like beta-hydroxyacid dehydrogenase